MDVRLKGELGGDGDVGLEGSGGEVGGGGDNKGGKVDVMDLFCMEGGGREKWLGWGRLMG